MTPPYNGVWNLVLQTTIYLSHRICFWGWLFLPPWAIMEQIVLEDFPVNASRLIIGNVCSLLATITDSISATRKTAKGMLMVQNLSQLFYIIGSIVLRGYSSAAQNFVSILRNFVTIRQIKSKYVEWTLVVLGVVLGIACNNLGLIGWLPILANLQYTLSVFRFKDNERALKVSFMVAVGMFVVFNFSILNIVGGISNLVVAVTTAIALLRKSENT